MKIKLLSLCLFIFIWAGHAQTVSVSGNVRDASTGEALIGVNVVVKGTANGTTTDLDGNYTLHVPSDATLVFSYIGYEHQEVPLNGRNNISVQLVESTKELDEVVVVGYTSQRRRDVLGAVAKVEGTTLSLLPVPGAEQALQGRVAGVQVSTSTGAPGAPVSVRIRGVGSVSSSNDPLYIIDGVAVDGGLSSISPNDIDNISVLKDASSAAIYGSRANNGVVLVTTKSGRKGEAKINYNGQYGFQRHGHITKMVNTADYISIYNEAATTDNASSVVKRPLIQGTYVKDFADVNYLEEIFQIAPLQSHELSVSGGNDKTVYFLSASYFNQDGIILNSDFNKGNLRSNISSDVKSWLTVGLNLSAGFSNTRSIPSSGDGYGNSEGGSVVRYAYFRNPAIPVYNSRGNYVDKPSEYYGDSAYDSFFGDGYNPVGWAKKTDRLRSEKNLLGIGNILIKLPLNLSLKTIVGFDFSSGEFRQFNDKWGTNDRINNPNNLLVEDYTTKGWNVNSVLNYSTTFNKKHTLSAMLGIEAIHNSGETLQATDQDFPSTDRDLLYIGKGVGKKTSYQNEWAYSLLSFFGSVNYNYDSKYYLSATIREDGSSRFTGSNKWGTFYSVSAGWNIESEDFLKDATNLTKLKLRAGWGAIGNQNIGLYAYSDVYSPDRNYPFGNTVALGYVQTKLGNEDLKWETSNQLNLGVDVVLFKNTFGFSVDYYYKITNDMLVQASYPPSVGYSSPPWINSGQVLNTGVDVEIFFRKDYKNKSGFDITFNGGFLHNEVLEMEAPIPGGRVDSGVFATSTEKGHPVGSFYMLEMDGIFQTPSDVVLAAVQGRSIQPGDIKYVDHYVDNKIDNLDRVHLGSAIPKFNLGLNLSGYWKDFDISCFFQGAFGHKIYMQVHHDIEGYYRGFPVTQRYFDEHWQGEGTSNTQPRASWSAKSNNVRVSSRFLESASYLRLKNLQIGYTIPGMNKIGIERLRVYLAGTNLFTFTKFTGMDPEMTVSANSTSEGDRASGIDWGTYPIAKTYTIGVNLTF